MRYRRSDRWPGIEKHREAFSFVVATQEHTTQRVLRPGLVVADVDAVRDDPVGHDPFDGAGGNAAHRGHHGGAAEQAPDPLLAVAVEHAHPPRRVGVERCDHGALPNGHPHRRNGRHQGFVDVHHVTVADRGGDLPPDSRVDADRSGRPIGGHDGGATEEHGAGRTLDARPDQHSFVPGFSEPSGQSDRLVLHSSVASQVVGAEDGDLHPRCSSQARSDGHSGWKRCHWVGRSRMISSSFRAISWVPTRIRSVRSSLSGISKGSCTTRR